MNFSARSWTYVAAAVISIFAIPVLALQNPGEHIAGVQGSSTALTSKYVLGPGDEFVIYSDAPEVNDKKIRVPPDGEISLPEVGPLHADGMSIQELQARLTEQLKRLYRNPHVSLSLTQFRSQPVSVYGAMAANGEYQLEGTKTLTQILSKAGGPRTDAGYRVIIKRQVERGAIPLPSNTLDPSGKFYIAEVKLRDLVYSTHPENDIEMLSNDTITVPPGEIVYVTGAVNKQGGFILDNPTIPVGRLIALAEGTKRTAKLKSAVILREMDGGSLQDIPIDLTGLNDRKGDNKVLNMELQPRDILLIEDSAIKGQVRSTAETVLHTLTGLAIYRIP